MQLQLQIATYTWICDYAEWLVSSCMNAFDYEFWLMTIHFSEEMGWMMALVVKKRTWHGKWTAFVLFTWQSKLATFSSAECVKPPRLGNICQSVISKIKKISSFWLLKINYCFRQFSEQKINMKAISVYLSPDLILISIKQSFIISALIKCI